MGEPALKTDVVRALKARADLTVTEMADGSLEVACVGQPIRRLLFGATVSRKQLRNLERWYKIPRAAFFPSTSTRPQSSAAGE